MNTNKLVEVEARLVQLAWDAERILQEYDAPVFELRPPLPGDGATAAGTARASPRQPTARQPGRRNDDRPREVERRRQPEPELGCTLKRSLLLHLAR